MNKLSLLFYDSTTKDRMKRKRKERGERETPSLLSEQQPDNWLEGALLWLRVKFGSHIAHLILKESTVLCMMVLSTKPRN